MKFLRSRQLITLILGTVLWIAGAGELFAQPDALTGPVLTAPGVTVPNVAARDLTPSAGVSMTPEQTRQSVQWLAEQLMLHVPRKIEGDDDWGETKRVWAGVKLHRDKWELKTNRRWRELRHGRWVRYEIRLPQATLPFDPSAPVLTEIDSARGNSVIADAVEIHSVAAVMTPGGDRRWRIDASVATPAAFAVRVERWNLGAKWYSIEIEGKMKLHMRTTLTMALEADFAEVPPALELRVEIENASLAVSGFEVERISKLGGDVAEEIGNLTEKTIGKIWIRKENARLRGRLNKAIAGNRDSLRWSMADWLAQLAQ